MICNGEDGEEELPFVAGSPVIDGLGGDCAEGAGVEELVATGAAGSGGRGAELDAGGRGAELDVAGP